MKRHAAAGAALLVAAVAAAAFPDHAPVAMTGGFGEATCASCHFGSALNDADGSFAVDGVPARYSPGATYDLRVRLARPGMEAAGFQLTARYADGTQAGALDAGAGAEVRVHEGVRYAGHTDVAAADAGEAAWTVRWTAPESAGAVVFHAVANAADGDESPLGDYVYTAEIGTRP